ncbi:tetratricopeptide repeat protein [Gracilinema caldarium]|uniref:Tetratricopeptide TPR_1 repeat-containing protein n=1 Tax=Gracilinema caldarium (strain ATCC 51460 / DSM 7334 / H1) TaxID=744872 RepID=F8F159_GRAC1|nr:tetratricopeptide repeat protein [Gracilinema caldarium]AEJ20849.1 Tetratricopeptide TPR_1 repeat-containing protein [Gracilinema caldarium DSM 7334]
MKKLYFFTFGIVCIVFTSCSSAPKTPPQSLSIRNEAGRLVLLGAKSLREGYTEAAKEYYTEAYRLYTLVDEPEGRIRALDGLGRVSGVGFDAWQKAQELAFDSGIDEMIALAGLLEAEKLLLSGDAESIEQARNMLVKAIEILNSRQSDKARALRLYGSVLKQLQHYSEALQVLKSAIDIDKKNKSFIELASDYYLMASIYSKQNDYLSAIQYLVQAIEYDRRAENGSGLGSDYLALGTVYEKMGNMDKAKLHYKKALDIFTAGRFSEKINEVQNRIDILQ